MEGLVDQAVVHRLISHSGCEVATLYPAGGKQQLLDKLTGYNAAAKLSPWVVLVDLDHDADCAPPFVEKYMPQPADMLAFRVAVREVEAWLMADTDGLASFLRVARSRVPTDPESLDSPKQAIVSLARRSRDRGVVADMVPAGSAHRSVGRGYTGRMIEFAREHWDPDAAAERSDSLRRCVWRLRELS